MNQEEKELRDKKSLKQYIIFALGLSFLLEIAYIIAAKLTGGAGFLMVAVMWTPAITAIVIAIKNYHKISMLGVSIGKATPLLLGLFLPVIYLTLSYLLAWVITKDPTRGFEALALDLGWKDGSGDLPFLFVLTHVAVGIFPSMAGAFGEELGWRGFMYPVMERVHGRKKALLVSGGIQALWHLPLVLAGLYVIETPLWYGVIMFMIYEVVLCTILAWLRSVSKSILPPLLIHASSNLVGQLVLNELSTKSGVPYLAGETGIITIVLMVGVAALGLFLWKKHDIKVEEAKAEKLLASN